MERNEIALKKILLLTVSILIVVGLGFFYASWYDYEKEASGQQASIPSPIQTPAAQEKIYVEKFDPNEKSAIQSTSVLQGSYSIEGDSGDRYAWVKQNSKILLKNVEGKSIVVKGYVPITSHQKANHVAEFSIDFVVDGQSVQKLTVNEDKLFEQIIPFDSIRSIVKSNECELEIKTNNQFVPASTGLGSDTRDLSMMIKYIGLK